MIDWQKLSEEYGLTPEEFKKEIYTCAAIVGAMDLDEQPNGTALRFTCEDERGQLVLEVKRK